MDGFSRFLKVVPFLVIPGIFAISYGIWLLSGKRKDYYIVTHIFAGRVYAGIPWGVAALIWAIGTIPESSIVRWIFLWSGIGLGLLGMIFYVVQPSFLKPAWLKWLEREHGDILPILQQEAQAMGLKVWEKRVETQAGLEQWVAEVRRKYKQ